MRISVRRPAVVIRAASFTCRQTPRPSPTGRWTISNSTDVTVTCMIFPPVGVFLVPYIDMNVKCYVLQAKNFITYLLPNSRRRYMVGILPIRRKTQNNQSINQSWSQLFELYFSVRAKNLEEFLNGHLDFESWKVFLPQRMILKHFYIN